MNEKAKKLSKENIIVDGHIDLPFRLYKENLLKEENINLNKNTSGNFDTYKAKKGGLNCPFMAIYTPSEKTENESYTFANSLIDLVYNVIKSNKEFDYAFTPKDVIKNFKKNKISLPMGMENGSPIGKDINRIKYFFDRGIRYMTLTHAADNQICDSSYDSRNTWNGLSDFGRKVVREMNKIGMMIDVSHCTDKTFYDILKITNKPLVATHSSPRKFTPNFERNMSDNMIKDLANNNGLIMLNFGSGFISEQSNKSFGDINSKVEKYKIENNLKDSDKKILKYKDDLINTVKPFASINDFVDTIDHVKELVGIDHIGLGSDFEGLGNTLPYDLKDASTYPNILYKLLEREYSQIEIKKICSDNLFRVWNANLQNRQI